MRRDPPGRFLTIIPLGRVRGDAERSLEQEASMWTKPEYTEMRFGFEVTMYIASR